MLRRMRGVVALVLLATLVAACSQAQGSPTIPDLDAVAPGGYEVDIGAAPVRECGAMGRGSAPANPPEGVVGAGVARFRVGDPARFTEGFFAAADDGRHPGVKVPLYIAGTDSRQVVLSIPVNWRGHVGLGYAPAPPENAKRAHEGLYRIGVETDHTVVFVPCEDAEWTFFAGGITAADTACVPIDVFDGHPAKTQPQRALLPLTSRGCP